MDVLIVGGGYAGVSAIRVLERRLPEEATIGLLDSTGTHLVQHLLHRGLRRPDLLDRIEIPLERIVRRTEIHKGTAVAVDPDSGIVETRSGETYRPDWLLIAAGAVTADYGIDGVVDYAIPFKRIEHVNAVRGALSGQTETAEILVCGAGLSGIQVAGELAADRQGTVQVSLVEQAETVAPGFPTPFQEAIESALVDLGVEILTDHRVDAVRRAEIEFDRDGSRPHDLVIWTGGITGSRILDGERPEVRADLRLGDRTFAAGDVISVVDERGRRVPASARTAVDQGRMAAANIQTLVEDEGNSSRLFDPRLDRYRDDDPGWMVSVGDTVVGVVGDTVVTGSTAKAMKLGVGMGYLGSIGQIGESVRYLLDSVK